MEIRDLFDFRSRLLSSTVQVRAAELNKDENGTNSHWNLIKGNYQGISFPVTFKQEYGKNLADILDTGWPSLYLISDRLKDTLEGNALTGWQTFPIKLYNKTGNEILDYHGFSVTGRSSPTSYDNCKTIERRMVSNGPICKFYKGVSIESWDGSDFFTPEGTYEIFITKKAAELLKKNKITNLKLINLADSEIDVDNILKKDS